MEDFARFPVGINYTNYNLKQIPHSSHLGHSAGVTTSASVGSASIRVEDMGEHSNTLIHDHESPRQIGELRSNGASSDLHEPLRELSLPEDVPQQDLSLPAEHSIESHEELPLSSSNQVDSQGFHIPDMHLSDAQPGSSLHTDEHVDSSDGQLELSMPTVEPVHNSQTLAAQLSLPCADFPSLRELGFAIFASFGKEFPNFALLIIRVDLVEILA
ncbi:hypothetical protein GQ457_18G010670 [Hibiscus cannabinus]